MGGDVGIDSALGKGTRVWFRVRAGVVAESEDTPLADRLPVPADIAPLARGGQGFVLVAEDNAINRKVVEHLLGKLRIDYRSVENGRDAVEAITAGAVPTLILMDCQMPVMDGYSATEKIRQWERAGNRPRVPIVALTADAFAEDRDRCREAGMDDFLSKPLKVAALVAILEKWQPVRPA
jgi:CheY-like chemotaxis protein